MSNKKEKNLVFTSKKHCEFRIEIGDYFNKFIIYKIIFYYSCRKSLKFEENCQYISLKPLIICKFFFDLYKKLKIGNFAHP